MLDHVGVLLVIPGEVEDLGVLPSLGKRLLHRGIERSLLRVGGTRTPLDEGIDHLSLGDR